MARAKRKAVIYPPPRISVSETDFLKNPAEAFEKVESGYRVELIAADGTTRMVIFPGTIADVPVRD